jgi:hypothetical protein
MTKEQEKELTLTVYISLLSRFNHEQFNDDALILRTFNNAKKFSKDAINKQYETRESN